MDKSPPMADRLVEEWKREAQKQIYLESLKTYFNEFLSLNPDF